MSDLLEMMHAWKDRAEAAEEDRDRARARVTEVERERDAKVDELVEAWDLAVNKAEAAQARLAEVEAERDEAVAGRDYQNAAAREFAKTIKRHVARVRELEAGCDKWERAEARLDALADEVWRRSDVPIDLRKKARALLTGEPEPGRFVCPDCDGSGIRDLPATASAPFGFPCGRCQGSGREPEGGEG